MQVSDRVGIEESASDLAYGWGKVVRSLILSRAGALAKKEVKGGEEVIITVEHIRTSVPMAIVVALNNEDDKELLKKVEPLLADFKKRLPQGDS